MTRDDIAKAITALRAALDAQEPTRKAATVDTIHSCHPDCDRPACVAVREAVKVEREACAMVCEEISGPIETYNPKYAYFLDCADAIRARGKNK